MRKLTTLFTVLFSLSAILCCGADQKKQTTIRLNLKGVPEGYLIARITQINENDRTVLRDMYDTIQISNGQNVTFTPRLEHFSIITVFHIPRIDKYGGRASSPSQEIYLFAKPGEKINVTGERLLNTTFVYKTTGNELNQAYGRYLERSTPYSDIFNTVIYEYPNPKKRPAEEQAKINKALDDRSNVHRTYYIQHANTPIAAFLYIQNLYHRFPQLAKDLPAPGKKALDSPLGIYYEDGVKQMEEGKKRTKEYQIKDSLRRIEIKEMEKNTAPDFTLKSTDGKEITLSSFKGKYVVLDFWYIGCQFCPTAFADLKKYQQKYPDAFQVISINISDTLDAVRQAEQDLKLEGFINTADAGKLAQKVYKIIAVPELFLIHPDGKPEYLNSCKRLDELFGKAAPAEETSFSSFF